MKQPHTLIMETTATVYSTLLEGVVAHLRTAHALRVKACELRYCPKEARLLREEKTIVGTGPQSEVTRLRLREAAYAAYRMVKVQEDASWDAFRVVARKAESEVPRMLEAAQASTRTLLRSGKLALPEQGGYGWLLDPQEDWMVETIIQNAWEVLYQ